VDCTSTHRGASGLRPAEQHEMCVEGVTWLLGADMPAHAPRGEVVPFGIPPHIDEMLDDIGRNLPRIPARAWFFDS